MSGCGEDKVRLVFLRHLDGLMTGGHCFGSHKSGCGAGYRDVWLYFCASVHLVE